MNELSKIAAILGRKGGKNNVKKHGKKHMSEIGKKGITRRWELYRKKELRKKFNVYLLEKRRARKEEKDLTE